MQLDNNAFYSIPKGDVKHSNQDSLGAFNTLKTGSEKLRPVMDHDNSSETKLSSKECEPDTIDRFHCHVTKK